MDYICYCHVGFYCSTYIEPTASFLGSSEFITTGYKLEVGHRCPGAPLLH